MITQRKHLVLNKIYFIDDSTKTKGVFKGRDKESIYFECDEHSPYWTSNTKGKEHLTPFNLEGDGFEEVLIGDDLTDENVEFLNSLNDK
jgi:hypothetical protein